MIEITNKEKSPVQIIVRSKSAPLAMATFNIPGVGAKKNKVLIRDEQKTEYIDRVEKMGRISTRYIPNQSIEQ